MAGGLFLFGLLLSAGALWQMRRLLSRAQGSLKVSAAQIERLAEELISTAEAAASTVVEQTESLERVVSEARSEREQLQNLLHAVAEGGAAAAAPEPAPPDRPAARPEMAGQATVLAARAAAQREASPGGSKLTPPKEIPPLHRQVYTLIDQGKPQAEVARQLKLSKGEIELILGLRATGV